MHYPSVLFVCFCFIFLGDLIEEEGSEIAKIYYDIDSYFPPNFRLQYYADLGVYIGLIAVEIVTLYFQPVAFVC